jgi:hypothetical protein
MTFTLILILNLVLDIAILGTLSFVMSRAAKLRPHGEIPLAPVSSRRQATVEPARARREPAVSTARQAA